jgi:hypothetical protein
MQRESAFAFSLWVAQRFSAAIKPRRTVEERRFSAA